MNSVDTFFLGEYSFHFGSRVKIMVRNSEITMQPTAVLLLPEWAMWWNLWLLQLLPSLRRWDTYIRVGVTLCTHAHGWSLSSRGLSRYSWANTPAKFYLTLLTAWAVVQCFLKHANIHDLETSHWLWLWCMKWRKKYCYICLFLGMS